MTTSTACVDCGGAPAFEIFDGARMCRVCAPCSARRCHGAVPESALRGEGWVIGHAARTDRVFLHCDQTKLFARGCFLRACEQPIVLAVNHACVRDFTFGQPWTGDIDWRHVLASTRDQTLLVAEDQYGLFFAAWFPTTACVLYTDAAPINIHQAIARGQCPGLSIMIAGGDRVVGRRDVAADVVYVRAAVPELSLMLPPETAAGGPGTWVQPAGRAAMTALYARLRTAAATVHAEGVDTL